MTVGEDDYRMCRAGRTSILVEYVQLQLHPVFSVLDLLLRHCAPDREGVALLVDRSVLASNLTNFGFVSDPVT